MNDVGWCKNQILGGPYSWAAAAIESILIYVTNSQP